MDSRYSHQQTEEKIYKLWEDTSVFNPDSVRQIRESENSPILPVQFSIIMPPPNANDPLHVGHALFVSLEDVMIRYNRMLGKDTVWIPGTDHAGIETQFVFEKKLKKEKKSRFNFDRKTLYQMIWDYVQENSGVAIDQIKKLGASADWSRYKFTLDEDVVQDVLKTFKQLHEDGLVYRDLQLVNYCTKCGTSYSELEVNHVEQTDPLYTIQYGPLSVSTVRLETIFGDVAVAVNPNDERYKHLIGAEIEAEYPWGTKKMPVIADEYVDPEFGTGAVKVTPYHDPNDFQMWTNHKSEIAEIPHPVINTSGKLTSPTSQPNLVPEKYQNLTVLQARKAVFEDYQSYNNGALLLEEKKNYTHSVGTCYRCSRQIEPLPLPQFFIKVNDSKNSLVKKALGALDSNETKIYGAGREKILRHWLNNLKDWNISRQIVWGISIPVWYEVSGNENNITVNYLDENKKYTSSLLSKALEKYDFNFIEQNLQSLTANPEVPYVVSLNNPSNDKKYFLQETDTFDTWFSSSQWPVVTLQNTQEGDFDRFYPTSVMETGYDILPFWVMRMMLLGLYSTEKSPFSHVYLHGLVRDEKGQKMSKSKGNVINPLEVKEEFGADALRMALVIRSTAGQDKSVGRSDFKAMRNLTNKVWNAARFVLLQLDNPGENSIKNNAKLDETSLERLKQVATDITQQLEDFRIGMAAETTYNEFWHWYCDEVIEQVKNGEISVDFLKTGLITFLKLLHPFMPFVTEAIWQELREQNIVSNTSLSTSNWIDL